MPKIELENKTFSGIVYIAGTAVEFLQGTGTVNDDENVLNQAKAVGYTVLPDDDNTPAPPQTPVKVAPPPAPAQETPAPAQETPAPEKNAEDTTPAPAQEDPVTEKTDGDGAPLPPTPAENDVDLKKALIEEAHTLGIPAKGNWGIAKIQAEIDKVKGI
jgi:hypothetical protein